MLSLLVLACNRNRVETSAVPQVQATAVADTPAVAIAPVAMTDTMLYYSRGACFGMCPIFELTVMKDGRAIYIGKNHVDRIGSFYAITKFSDIEHVLAKAAEIGYFQMNTVYDNDRVHDLPNIITGIAHDGRLYRVLNRYKGPASLQRIYAELDTLIEHQQWQPLGSNK
ncbi:MAG: DUF6438 domain-containing protein [Flavobacteriales bacterium]